MPLINVDLAKVNLNSKDNMIGYLGIEITEAEGDHIIGRMPVDDRTRQPYGILHGGASVVLAETLGSIGSAYMVDLTKVYPVGLEINANHIRSVSSGFVTGKATILHEGKSTHIWEVRITDEQMRLVCISRLTVAIIERRN